ncbi:MAG: cyclase family protein [Planctomycetota bacterium]
MNTNPNPKPSIAILFFITAAALLTSILPVVHAAEVVMTRQDFEDAMVAMSNWGKWGKDDQKGTLNYITPEVRRRAAQLVTEGVVVSLARNADKEKAIDNARPYVHTIEAAKPDSQSSGDSFAVSPHGVAHTHIDALCHQLHEGKMYNGFTYKDITDRGALKNSILNQKDGIFTRAVLFDIPALKGVPYLEDGAAIYPADLDAWERRTGIRVRQGDIVLFRTGHWLDRKENGPKRGARPGIEGIRGPAHDLAIVAMGMPILDAADFGPLAIECQKRQRWTFLLTMAPLAIPGATGSPVNPTAVF